MIPLLLLILCLCTTPTVSDPTAPSPTLPNASNDSASTDAALPTTATTTEAPFVNLTALLPPNTAPEVVDTVEYCMEILKTTVVIFRENALYYLKWRRDAQIIHEKKMSANCRDACRCMKFLNETFPDVEMSDFISHYGGGCVLSLFRQTEAFTCMEKASRIESSPLLEIPIRFGHPNKMPKCTASDHQMAQLREYLKNKRRCSQQVLEDIDEFDKLVRRIICDSFKEGEPSNSLQ